MENAMDDDNGASTSTQMHDLDKVILLMCHVLLLFL
jgi:hypothetical protein